MGHSDRFEQRASKRTTDNFAFEGLNMHRRPMWATERGVNTIVWPRHTDTHTLHVTDGRMLEEVNSEHPPPSLLLPSLLRTAGRQTFLLLSFQRKTKECVGPLLHTRACVQTHIYTTPSPKTVNATVGWSYFNSPSPSANRRMSAELGTFVEGESRGDNPNPAYQSWHSDVLVGT